MGCLHAYVLVLRAKLQSHVDADVDSRVETKVSLELIQYFVFYGTRGMLFEHKSLLFVPIAILQCDPASL